MNFHITGRNLDITPAIHEYAINKLGKLEKYVDAVVDAHVVLSIVKLDHIAEITLRVAGKDLHSSATEESIYAAIDILADKAERQVRKHKSKVSDHTHQPHKRMEPTPAADEL